MGIKVCRQHSEYRVTSATEDIEKSSRDCSVILELAEAVLNKNSNFLGRKNIEKH